MSAIPRGRRIAACLVLSVGVIAGGSSPTLSFGHALAAEDCTSAAALDYTRKSDLPDGVMAAIGWPMADAGERFRATDVVQDKDLPFRRFVSARRTGCALHLRYERGGIALRQDEIDLDFMDGKWTVRKP